MDFNDIDKDFIERETTFHDNTVAFATTPEPQETAEKTKDERVFENLRTDRNSHDRKHTEQDSKDGRIKCLIYMILALVLVLYAAAIAFIIVIVVPKEQDGVWSNWESWSTCSESCGGGIMSRNRTCSGPAPLGLRKQCIGNFEKVELCNKQPCPGTDGSWANWENWSMCTDSCGGGIMSRHRTCSNPAPVGLGKQCIGNSEQVELCNKQPCPGTDGGWSRWESWSTCSESCGGGLMSRNRTCSNPVPEGMGKHCVGIFEQVRLCNKEPCPGTDGGWSVWESWGSCSHSCGGGVRSRSRSCTNPSPSPTGRPCTGDFTDVSICNRTTCPGHNVAFTAYDINTTLASETVLQFRQVYLNNGNAYNTTSGIFTCNVPGVYHFVITLTKTFRDIGQITAYLRINSSNILTLFYNPRDDNSNELGTSIMTGASTFHLDQNDTVDVYGVPNYLNSFSESSFTGILITPDQ